MKSLKSKIKYYDYAYFAEHVQGLEVGWLSPERNGVVLHLEGQGFQVHIPVSRAVMNNIIKDLQALDT